jgi:hypothetical protein
MVSGTGRPFTCEGIKIRNKPSAKALRRAFRIGGMIRSAEVLVQSPNRAISNLTEGGYVAPLEILAKKGRG